MKKEELLAALRTLVENEDALSVARDVSELRSRFEDVIIEEERQHQIKQLETQESGETLTVSIGSVTSEAVYDDSVKNEFYEIYTAFKEKRNVQQRIKNDTEELNLRKKKALIQRLKTIIESEENIGAALNAYKEIHEEWKTIGDIHREKRQEIQSEYSRLLETFFYHIKIYRELREHDLHRNHQLKLEVVKRIQELQTVENLKDAEQSLKALQNEWDEIGPVGNDDWENLKTSYWENVRVIYTRIQGFYDERRNELQGNLERKKALVEQVNQFIQKDTSEYSAKEWDSATAELLKFQEEWKTIGFGPKKENEEVWKAFRAGCDQFFTAKKTFFDSLRGQFDELAKKKQALIDKVNALKDSTDWKTTTEKIVQYQQQWKTIGNAGQRNEQKLWSTFRAGCDAFFNAKQAHFAQQDLALVDNLTAKMALIERIKSEKLPTDKKEALSQLRQYATDFNAIGFVPMKEKDTVFNGYKEALDAHYQGLKLEGAEKDRINFEARMDTLKASPNADKAIARERQDLKDKMNQIKSEMLQYENNLGFFAKSKGADSLRKEVEQKIDVARKKVEEIQRKLKQLV